MKDKRTKGFTLVEIIVVLVIIAILAATTLPALTGYIEQARDKTAMSEARTCLVALQTISTELYSMGCTEQNSRNYLLLGKRGTGTGAVPASYTKTVASLTGDDYFKDLTKIKHLIYNDRGTIVIMELYASNNRSVIFKDGQIFIGTYVP